MGYQRVRIIRISKLKYILCGLCGLLALLSVGTYGQGIIKSMAKNAALEQLSYAFCDSMPMAKAVLKPKLSGIVSINQMFFGFDIRNPSTILTNQISVVSAANISIAEKREAVAEATPTPAASSAPVKEEPKRVVEINASSNNKDSHTVAVKNNTKYNVNIGELQNGILNFNLSKPGPKVLIVHSHTSESYAATDANYYLPSDPDRTEDQRYNVVRVGDEMTKVLTDMGVKVIHDKTVHDFPSYNGSYKNALATVEENLKKYPSIKIVIDVHRDALIKEDKTKLKVVTTINNEKIAQMMIVTGTDQGGLAHPNWQENLKFATKFQARMDKMYPTLARPINLTKERYNTHTTLASVILEVGSNGNTLEEAIKGGRYAAKALGDLVLALD